ncbi:DUF4907 domain-containing protein [Zunongwangia sp. H14]|uniref:DUF4907 domain-containing protein n=1 Tax=Zunongwangia sp. H14 TaxID=3240792 RepID=UPI003563128B
MLFKLGYRILFSLVLIFIIVAGTVKWGSTVGKDNLSVVVFKGDNGYGYSINAEGKPLIKQEYIPAIEEKISFSTATDAEKVGCMVRAKLRRRIKPSISCGELKKLGIYIKQN